MTNVETQTVTVDVTARKAELIGLAASYAVSAANQKSDAATCKTQQQSHLDKVARLALAAKAEGIFKDVKDGTKAKVTDGTWDVAKAALNGAGQFYDYVTGTIIPLALPADDDKGWQVAGQEVSEVTVATLKAMATYQEGDRPVSAFLAVMRKAIAKNKVRAGNVAVQQQAEAIAYFETLDLTDEGKATKRKLAAEGIATVGDLLTTLSDDDRRAALSIGRDALAAKMEASAKAGAKAAMIEAVAYLCANIGDLDVDSLIKLADAAADEIEERGKAEAAEAISA